MEFRARFGFRKVVGTGLRLGLFEQNVEVEEGNRYFAIQGSDQDPRLLEEVGDLN